MSESCKLKSPRISKHCQEAKCRIEEKQSHSTKVALCLQSSWHRVRLSYDCEKKSAYRLSISMNFQLSLFVWAWWSKTRAVKVIKAGII
jgi:hypothetical protein